jgi:hypothetical protein
VLLVVWAVRDSFAGLLVSDGGADRGTGGVDVNDADEVRRQQLDVCVAEALVVRPGDRVLLLVKEPTEPFWEMSERILAERFPDVEFTFVTQVDGAVVVRREPDPDESFVVAQRFPPHLFDAKPPPELDELQAKRDEERDAQKDAFRSGWDDRGKADRPTLEAAREALRNASQHCRYHAHGVDRA